jgi:uncharacterized membrane protein
MILDIIKQIFGIIIIILFLLLILFLVANDFYVKNIKPHQQIIVQNLKDKKSPKEIFYALLVIFLIVIVINITKSKNAKLGNFIASDLANKNITIN